MFRKIIAVCTLIIFISFVSFADLAGQEKTQEQTVGKTLELINQGYRDFFRIIDENFSINKTVFEETGKKLLLQHQEETKEIEARLKGLEEQERALRQVLKNSQNTEKITEVKLERLRQKREKDEKAGQDLSALDSEIEKLIQEKKDGEQTSAKFQQQLDGDTNFDFAMAVEKVENLKNLLEIGQVTKAEQLTAEKEIIKLEAEIETATGLRRRVRNVKKERRILEAKQTHQLSKLVSLKRWPGKLRQINENILASKQDQRRHGNIEAIGNPQERKLQKIKVLRILPGMISMNAEVQLGKELAQELLQSRRIQIHDNPLITGFVDKLGQKLVKNSDAWCPFDFYVIADPPQEHEINAFALPGGQVFVNDSLILAMKTEGELGGVIAHEIAHVTARHAAKRLSKMQYMQYGALAGVLFGGVGYWGYQGIGTLMNMAALGITRESEAEADQLGTQYLWQAGYDPRLLIDSFDRLLKDQRLSTSAFWHSHPSLDDRMEQVEEETRYLPSKEQQLVTSKEYAEIQRAIWESRVKIYEEVAHQDKNRPTLFKRKRPEENPPENPEDKPEKPTLKRPPKEEKPF